ncbi:hypothetical protein BDV25DRAFT_162483 [Aspergillus avenaceus]|uniref:Uncharacterized protein n=1 Tax=Aspergillus avenaceus TaxID=36643 RepID=A0A5N6TJY9_ASPAV|nr:hypothetical protein BDV25DRAFT_162483 [Aspergillus avenaceus]
MQIGLAPLRLVELSGLVNSWHLALSSAIYLVSHKFCGRIISCDALVNKNVAPCCANLTSPKKKRKKKKDNHLIGLFDDRLKEA